MTTKDDHHSGTCYCCMQDKPVRNKNLFTVGSEGTDVCMECEKVILEFTRNLHNTAFRERVRKIKIEALKKKYNGLLPKCVHKRFGEFADCTFKKKQDGSIVRVFCVPEECVYYKPIEE